MKESDSPLRIARASSRFNKRSLADLQYGTAGDAKKKGNIQESQRGDDINRPGAAKSDQRQGENKDWKRLNNVSSSHDDFTGKTGRAFTGGKKSGDNAEH